MYAQYIDPNEEEELIEYDTELKNLDVLDRAWVWEHDLRLAERIAKKKRSKEPVVEEGTAPEIWLQWKVGDHCRALYAKDKLWYEAKIKAIQGDSCIIHYVGFDEDTEMKLNRLDASLGTKERKRQRAAAKEYLAYIANKTKKGNGAKYTYKGNGAKYTYKGNGAKSKSDIANPRHPHQKRDHYKPNENEIIDEVASGMPPVNKTEKDNGAKSRSEIASPRQRSDYDRLNENEKFDEVASGMPPVNKTKKGNGAKSKSEIASPRHPRRRRDHYRSNENDSHVVAIYPGMPPFAIPSALPMSELPNSSLFAMLSSWYMAGYYTGLNQAEKDSFHCCCCQNCC